MRFAGILLVIGVWHQEITMAQNNDISQKPLWESDKNGYHTYRIPAVTVTTQGTILAFCEGRKEDSGDSGKIDLLVRRSRDSGKTWSDQKVVWSDANNTCGNPSPVTDNKTGKIWLLGTWNRGDDPESQIIDGKSKDTRCVFVMSSSNDGLTWSAPKEITAKVKKPNWTWYATGPGSGIQIARGPYAGRLVIACDHIEAGTKHYYSHVIFSDDHGKTWELGGTTPQPQVNECEIVELSNGQLMLNMRNYNNAGKRRQTALSNDGGMTWSNQRLDETLIEPICQAGIQRYSWPDANKKNMVLFSNPANDSKRVNMTVRVSYDDCKTWAESLTLHEGPSAYSDLAVLPDGTAVCLYERGEKNPYEQIALALFKFPHQDTEGANGKRAETTP